MIVGGKLSWDIVLKYTGRPVLMHVVLAFGVVVAYQLLGAWWLAVPALPVTVLAAAIGVLLAFRNNSAYDRWWEARTLWGALVNMSRSFARQVLTFLPRTEVTSAEEPSLVQAASSSLLRTAVERAATVRGIAELVASDGAVRDRYGKALNRDHPEGRGLLATLETQQMARESQGRYGGPGHSITEDERELVYAQIGFVNALRCHLRQQDPFPEITPFFRASVLEALREEKNVPSAILIWVATRLRRIYGQHQGPDDVFRLVMFDRTLTELTNILGACERIKNTPIPLQYDVLPRAMVRAYLGILPLGVVADLAWLTPFVTAIIAFLFIAMDSVGRDVETPFEDGVSDTPMTALCRTIEINLRQMLGESELPSPLQPVDGLLY
ncbi:MAG TPA: bestrophin family ion channel [Archangium sp.]|jgi:putative membrane protein|uniref:bestrophin family protein n=1 Tax=Archangium sp. TaxID=1872627 RepID=UPI002ED990C4